MIFLNTWYCFCYYIFFIVGNEYTYYQGFAHLAAGLMAGLSALCAGICIGIVGDYGVRSFAREPKLFVGMLLILIFGEALALYGLIVGLIVGTKSPQSLYFHFLSCSITML